MQVPWAHESNSAEYRIPRLRLDLPQLEWDISMLFSRVHIALVLERPQRRDQFPPRLRWLNDGVYVAALGGHIWIREPLAELFYFFRTQGRPLVLERLLNLALINNIHRALRPHNRNLRHRPRVVDVRPDVLRRHNAIRTAVRLPRDHRNLRHRRFGKREQ